MNREEFDLFNEDILAKAKELRLVKGRDYQRATEDILSNFKSGAEKLHITILQDFGALFHKQVEAIYAYLATGKVESERIEGRIVDVINYMLLLNAIIHYLKSLEKTKEK